jgi:hypothetical protein
VSVQYNAADAITAQGVQLRDAAAAAEAARELDVSRWKTRSQVREKQSTHIEHDT